MVLVWSRKSYLGPAEIASFLFVVLFKDGGRRVSPRFHLFLVLIKGMKGRGGFKIFLRGPKDGKTLLRTS